MRPVNGPTEETAVGEDMMAWAQEWLNEPWVLALLVLVLAALSARLVDGVISRAMLRLARKTQTEMDEKVIGALHRPIFVTVLLIGVYVAALILEMNPILFRQI